MSAHARHPSPLRRSTNAGRPRVTYQSPPVTPHADIYYGHRDTAELCQRFIHALFACPDRPPSTTSRSSPTPPLSQFVAYALHRTRLHPSVTFTALFLLSRLKSRFPAARGSSGHRLFISAFMIASKIVCDDTYSNKSWAIVGQSMFSLREINQMEREMCNYLGWDSSDWCVDAKNLGEFEKKIRLEYAKDGPCPNFVHPGLTRPCSTTSFPSNHPSFSASQRSSDPSGSSSESMSSSGADTTPGLTWTPTATHSKEGHTTFLLIDHVVPGRSRSKVAHLVVRALRSFGAPFNHRRQPSILNPLDFILTKASNAQPLPRLRSHQGEPDNVMLAVETVGDHPMGMGGSSDVWQGIIITDEDSSPSLVAVKVLRQFSGSSRPHGLGKRLQREVRIWERLNHENIAGFHGVVYNSNGAPAIVSPWYANGSADVYLQQHPESNPMKLIWEIVLGVEYLHENGIVHGDLKGANVMVDDLGHARLIDFGLSRLLDSVVGASGLNLSTVAFSLRWCAPELVLSDKAQVTKSSDVYAYASTALQLVTGDVPYSSQGERTVLLTVLKKVPPPRPSTPLRYSITNVDELWGLLERCWAEAPQRPSISDVKHDMLTLYPVS